MTNEGEPRDYQDLINNSGLVDEQDPKYTKIFGDLQGGIIKNYGRQYALYLFIQFDPNKPNEVKQWIRDEIAQTVTSTLAQFKAAATYRETLKDPNSPTKDGELCQNFFLSAHGYKALGLTSAVLDDTHFVHGMKEHWEDSYRLDRANVPEPGEDYWYCPPDQWDMGDDPIDALITLAHSSLEQLASEAQALINKFSPVGKVLACETGYRLKNPDGYSVVSFGFADGISQPIFLKSDYDKYLSRQKIGAEETKIWNPQANLNLTLVQDPGGEAYSYGTYCVFQKIETNNDLYNKQLDELRRVLEVDEERAHALVMGRFRDGTPLTLFDQMSSAGNSANPRIDNFNFADDQQGSKCPLHAHVRKANPRNDEAKFEEDRKNNSRIVRAGITYFDNPPPPVGGDLLQACLQQLDYLQTLSTKTVAENIPSISGLLFVCFQGSIDNQFGFIQRQWMDDSEFPREREDGANKFLDPIVGHPVNINRQRMPVAQEWPKKWNEADRSAQSFLGCARVRGGEFFFAPSIGFLKKI